MTLSLIDSLCVPQKTYFFPSGVTVFCAQVHHGKVGCCFDIMGRRRVNEKRSGCEANDNSVYCLSDCLSKTSWPSPQLWIMYHEEQTHRTASSRDGNISLFSSAIQTDAKTWFLCNSCVALSIVTTTASPWDKKQASHNAAGYKHILMLHVPREFFWFLHFSLQSREFN